MLFIPLYWLFGWITGTYTLLLIQIVFIITGSWAVYKLILLKTKDDLLSVLALLQYYDDRKYAFYKSTMYKSDIDVKKVYKYFRLIPPDAKVSASGTIAPHLAFRDHIFYFDRVDEAEYLVIFPRRETYPLTREKFDRELERYRNDTAWQEVVNDDPLLILKRK